MLSTVPVSRSITSAIRSSVYSSPGEPMRRRSFQQGLLYRDELGTRQPG
jgi:hypothetical protein